MKRYLVSHDGHESEMDMAAIIRNFPEAASVQDEIERAVDVDGEYYLDAGSAGEVGIYEN